MFSYLKFILKRVRFFCNPKKPQSSYYIHDTAIIEDKKNIRIGKNTEIKQYCIIYSFDKEVSIGENVQINPFTVIFGNVGVTIGNNVMIAPHCVIVTGNHNYKQLEKPMRFADYFTKGPIVIEEDVWIGANCTIGDGVTIGKGAVVAANSFVNKDVAPYDIVGGVPARKIKSRLEHLTDSV